MVMWKQKTISFIDGKFAFQSHLSYLEVQRRQLQNFMYIYLWKVFHMPFFLLNGIFARANGFNERVKGFENVIFTRER
jgi:hypothetical protein